jgi:hypothetical protein
LWIPQPLFYGGPPQGKMSSGRLVSSKLGGARAAGLTTISFVASATSTSHTITIPASAQAGDVAILFDAAVSTEAIPGDVVPTGWTGIITATNLPNDGNRVRISYKILAGGDAGASVTSMDGTVADDQVMLVFRGNIAATAVSAEDWEAQATQNNPASQTVNASTEGTRPLVVFGMTHIHNGTAAFSTQSPAFAATVANSDNDLLVGYTIYNSADALSDHTVDMNDLGTYQALASGFLELS